MLIPGYAFKIDYRAFYVYGDGGEAAEWGGLTCLGVALSIAGALASAYNLGFDAGHGAAWVESPYQGPGDDSRY